MKNDKESFLNKLDFEDKGYLLSLYESVYKSSPDNLIAEIKPFMNTLSVVKLKLKVEQHPTNGLPKEEVLSTVKVFLIYTEISLFQEKFRHNEEVETNFATDSSLLINDIYKLLSLKGRNYSEGNKKSELDIIVGHILSKYIEGANSYNNFINILENHNKKNSSENMINANILSYDQFQKYFKIIIKFFIFSKGFEKIFNSIVKNDKIMTAELIVCVNKIIKCLNESNLFYLVAKKILAMIDTNKVTIDKNEFYLICLRALN